MTGKIITALTKIEAETYWSRGRLHEAMEIYNKLLSSSPDMTLNTRAAIESRRQLLLEQLERQAPRKNDQALESAVMKLHAAITSNESVFDLQRDAMDFYKRGLYADALESLKQLIRLNAGDEFCINTVVDCLTHLHSLREIAVAVDLLLVESFKNAEKAALFKLILADKMAQRGCAQYADVLYRHKDRFTSSTL